MANQCLPEKKIYLFDYSDFSSPGFNNNVCDKIKSSFDNFIKSDGFGFDNFVTKQLQSLPLLD